MSNQETNNSRFEELCSAYVLGALSPDEQKEFDNELANASEEELVLFEDLKATSAQIALLVKQEDPQSDLKNRILKYVLGKRANVTQIPSDSWTNTARYAAAASFLLFAISLALGIYSVNLGTEVENQQVVIVEQEARITDLTNDLDRKNELLAILESRDVDLVLMAGAEEVNPNGYGKVIWDAENQQAILQVANLPAVPTDKDYQLWLIQEDGTPINSGVLPIAGSDTDSFLKIERLAPKDPNANTFAITLEPKGGVPQPTGSIYLAGQTN